MHLKDIASSLRCPICHASLRTNAEFAQCMQHHQFPIREGIPLLVPKDNEDIKHHEAEFWDHRYGEERPEVTRNLAFHRAFRKPLEELPRGSLILEVGCGMRADSLELAEAGHRVVATDISEQALKEARTQARKRGVADRMVFLAADGEALPFNDATFDGCLIAASLHHLPHPLAGLKEMRRVVKPGGVIVAAVEPNAWPYYTLYPLLSPIKRLIRARRKRPLNSVADDHTKGFTAGQLRRLFEASNLTVVDLQPVKFVSELYDSGMRMVGSLRKTTPLPSPAVQRLLASVDARLGRIAIIRPLAWHWTVVARVP